MVIHYLFIKFFEFLLNFTGFNFTLLFNSLSFSSSLIISKNAFEDFTSTKNLDQDSIKHIDFVINSFC